MIKKRSWKIFIHSNFYLVPSTVLGDRDTIIPCQTRSLLSWKLHSRGKVKFQKVLSVVTKIKQGTVLV